MKRKPRPTDHYDENLIHIDEHICALLKLRKGLSNNPGIPSDDVISKWALKYELYEDFLYQLFGTMKYENLFKSRIEPTGFRKNLSVLKSVEVGERIYTVTVIKQYENASVIQLHIDWDEPDDSSIDLISKCRNSNFELFISEEYDCRKGRAGGRQGYYSYSFIVTPPLPDEISGFDFVFKEYNDNLKEKPTGLEIVMCLE